MDPECRPTFSQAVFILQSIDLSTSNNIIGSSNLIHQAMPEAPFKNTQRNSISDSSSSSSSSRRASKDWRRHSSCSDPGDAVQENKGDSGIDPGVFFSEQSKKRLSSSCGRLIAKMEEFTTFEELEAYLRSYTSSSNVGKEGASVEDNIPCSPSEHAKSNQTTSPQLVTPTVCKTNKPHLPDPSTPYAPPPTPCTSKIRPAISLPSLKDTVCDEMLPSSSTSVELSSSDVMSPCVRRRRTDIKTSELFSSPSTTVPKEAVLSTGMSPELLLEHNPGGFNNEHTHNAKFLHDLHPKRVSSSPNTTVASSVDSI